MFVCKEEGVGVTAVLEVVVYPQLVLADAEAENDGAALVSLLHVHHLTGIYFEIGTYIRTAHKVLSPQLLDALQITVC